MPVICATAADAEDLIFEVKGPIDERTEWPKFRLRLSQRVIFDCSRIERVNSIGAQRWVEWMRGQNSEQQFVFREAPHRLVDLFNSVEEFLPRATTVESFVVPYECESCGHEELFVARRGKDYVEAVGDRLPRLLFPDEINCGKCRNPAKPAIWPEKYFQFLKRLSYVAENQ